MESWSSDIPTAPRRCLLNRDFAVTPGRTFSALLYLLSLPPMIAIVTAILLFDGWIYLWRRVNHELGFLWRFHRLHHSDPEIDATTAIRFHTVNGY